MAIREMLLEAFRVPDGEYRLSQTGAGKSIGKHHQPFERFLHGQSPEAAQLKGLIFEQVSHDEHHIPAKTISIAEFTLYLCYWDKRGDAVAGAFVQALMQEFLERRRDRAFGVDREVEVKLRNSDCEMPLSISGSSIERAIATGMRPRWRRFTAKRLG